MTAHEALQEARSRGIVLTPVGTILRLRGPADALDEELERELKRHKPEILVLLKKTSFGVSVRPMPVVRIPRGRYVLLLVPQGAP